MVKEVARQQALRLGAQEPPPGGIHTTRSRPVAPRAEDPPHGRLAQMMAEAGQLAVHPAVSPGRVLPCQPQHQVADLRASPRAAWPVRVGPLAGEETAVPGQEGSRRDQPTTTQRGWQQPGKCRQDRPVGPVRPGPGDLAAQRHHLVPQRHDLYVLGRLASAQQDQPAGHPDHDQVQQTERHRPRSCLNSLTDTNRSSKPASRGSEAVQGGTDG
jgi:hypothetical protein